MNPMTRRTLLRAFWAAPASRVRAASTAIRGRLTRGFQDRLRLVVGERAVSLDGDQETLSVLGDPRLAGSELELLGEFQAPDRFYIGPFHTKSLRVIRNGRKYLVTYWCDICSIRSYTPGECVCCQQETALDLRPLENEP